MSSSIAPKGEGATDLGEILRTLRPVLVPGSFVFVTLTREDVDVSRLGAAEVFATVREAEGTSHVITKRDADASGLAYDATFVAGWITLEVHSSLSAVGLTAAVAQVLAAENISCNVIAGRYHDHLLVPEVRVEDALLALKRLTGGF